MQKSTAHPPKTILLKKQLPKLNAMMLLMTKVDHHQDQAQVLTNRLPQIALTVKETQAKATLKNLKAKGSNAKEVEAENARAKAAAKATLKDPKTKRSSAKDVNA